MTGFIRQDSRNDIPAFHKIGKYPSFAVKYRAINSCIKWNERETAKCVREHSRVKNYDRRKELERNASRHTATAQRLRGLVAQV